MNQMAGGARCNACNQKYRWGVRLPNSWCELIRVSLRDRNTITNTGLSVLIWAVLVTVTSMLEGASVGERWSWPAVGGMLLVSWILTTTTLLVIFFSPRFNRVVSNIWFYASTEEPPLLLFYWKMYLYFTVANTLFILSHTPILERLSIVSVQCWPQNWPLWLHLAANLNALLLHGAGWSIITIFYRTNYRIPTIDNCSSDSPNLQHPLLASWGNQ